MPNPVHALAGDSEEIKAAIGEADALLTEANELLKKADRTPEDAKVFTEKMERINKLTRSVEEKRAVMKADQVLAGLRTAELEDEAARRAKGGEGPSGYKAPYDMPDGKGGVIKAGQPLPAFKTFANMLYSVYLSYKMGQPDPRLKMWEGESNDEMQSKALTDASAATGGALVPIEYRNVLMGLAAERAIVRPRATVIRMTRRQMQMPMLDQTGVPDGSGNSAFFGGITVTWLEADAPKQKTQPSFRQVTLTAREVSAYTEVSNTLMDDSAIALEDFLQSQLGFAGAMVHAEDWAFLQGDGNGKPIGVLNAPATVKINRNSPNEINYVDVVTMMSRSLMGGNYVWVSHQTSIPQIFTMQDGAGNNIWLPHTAGVAGQAPGTLLGYPILFTEKVPALGSFGDFGLYDFGYYLIGDRQLITIDMSQHFLFQTNQTAWRIIQRVEGKPWLPKPITLADGTTTVSPFVALDEPA